MEGFTLRFVEIRFEDVRVSCGVMEVSKSTCYRIFNAMSLFPATTQVYGRLAQGENVLTQTPVHIGNLPPGARGHKRGIVDSDEFELGYVLCLLLIRCVALSVMLCCA